MGGAGATSARSPHRPRVDSFNVTHCRQRLTRSSGLPLCIPFLSTSLLTHVSRPLRAKPLCIGSSARRPTRWVRQRESSPSGENAVDLSCVDSTHLPGRLCLRGPSSDREEASAKGKRRQVLTVSGLGQESVQPTVFSTRRSRMSHASCESGHSDHSVSTRHTSRWPMSNRRIGWLGICRCRSQDANSIRWTITTCRSPRYGVSTRHTHSQKKARRSGLPIQPTTPLGFSRASH